MRRTTLALTPLVLLVATTALASSKADIEAGEQLYEESCAACHGEKLRNQGQSFDLRRLEPHERARFDKAVLEGRANMPPWRGILTEKQLDQLWAYVMEHAR